SIGGSREHLSKYSREAFKIFLDSAVLQLLKYSEVRLPDVYGKEVLNNSLWCVPSRYKRCVLLHTCDTRQQDGALRSFPLHQCVHPVLRARGYPHLSACNYTIHRCGSRPKEEKR